MSSKKREKRQRRRKKQSPNKALVSQLARWETEHKGKYNDGMLQRALLCQGSNEAAISFYEQDLQRSLVACIKNPQHIKFTPAADFTVENLPAGFQDTCILECVHRLITLSGILKVGHTSKRRTNLDFFEQRGKHAPKLYRWGSGSAFIPRRRRKGHVCPCRSCINSSSPSKIWYFVWISTAHHVVLDDSEAARTMFGMYFHNSRKQTKWLHGVRLVNFDADCDRSIVECVTHDTDVYMDIINARSFLHNKEIELCQKYAKEIAEKGGPPLAVIVSHPHGCNKQISVGTHVEKKYMRDNCQQVEWTKYIHDVPTCVGCSGALLWLLGQQRVGYRDKLITTHTHTGLHDKKMNSSGGGLDFVSHCSGVLTNGGPVTLSGYSLRSRCYMWLPFLSDCLRCASLFVVIILLYLIL